MNQDRKKQAAAESALEYVPDGGIVGIGTGTTVNHFIPMLARIKDRIDGTVASSEATAVQLRRHGIRLYNLNQLQTVDVYIDGADESTRYRQLIKGGGGALTREKIIAGCAEYFVCILDDSKLVERLGAFPVAVEVIPSARESVIRRLLCYNGAAQWRRGFITDNGNQLLDVTDMELSDPSYLESAINQIPGVVECGIFGSRRADILLVAGDNGVFTL